MLLVQFLNTLFYLAKIVHKFLIFFIGVSKASSPSDFVLLSIENWLGHTFIPFKVLKQPKIISALLCLLIQAVVLLDPRLKFFSLYFIFFQISSLPAVRIKIYKNVFDPALFGFLFDLLSYCFGASLRFCY